MTEVNFSRAYFIKLGRSGGWEKDCIEGGLLRLGFNNPFHKECTTGQYECLREWLESNGRTKGVVTSIVNLVRTFYEADEQTLWITFYQRRLWWGFASPGIKQLEDGSRIRTVINGWRSTDTSGEVLSVDRISGRLAKVQMYQGTVCRVREFRYLHRRINGIVSPEVAEATQCLCSLTESISKLITLCTWKDFELLVDLVFTDAGWKRIGVRGKTEKDIDLDLLAPVSGKRAFVQVKSSSTQTEFDKYVRGFLDNDMYDEMYYVVHTLRHELEVPNCARRIEVLSGRKLATLVVNAGMADWLIEKAT